MVLHLYKQLTRHQVLDPVLVSVFWPLTLFLTPPRSSTPVQVLKERETQKVIKLSKFQGEINFANTCNCLILSFSVVWICALCLSNPALHIQVRNKRKECTDTSNSSENPVHLLSNSLSSIWICCGSLLALKVVCKKIYTYINTVYNIQASLFPLNKNI